MDKDRKAIDKDHEAVDKKWKGKIRIVRRWIRAEMAVVTDVEAVVK